MVEQAPSPTEITMSMMALSLNLTRLSLFGCVIEYFGAGRVSSRFETALAGYMRTKAPAREEAAGIEPVTRRKQNPKQVALLPANALISHRIVLPPYPVLSRLVPFNSPLEGHTGGTCHFVPFVLVVSTRSSWVGGAPAWLRSLPYRRGSLRHQRDG